MDIAKDTCASGIQSVKVFLFYKSCVLFFKMKFTARFCAVLLVLWVHSSFVSCEGEIDYDYSNGPNGPENWGDLPGSGNCSAGTEQSPININKPLNWIFHTPLDVVLTTSDPVPCEIYNNGHTPTVEVPEGVQLLTISDVTYELKDFHFHIPSEHTRFGIRFAMEMHFVHISEDGKVAVIGLLFNTGSTNAFLAQFFGNLPSFSSNERTPINIAFPTLQPFSYFQYNGSLTTPPCTEGVAWTVINKVYELSDTQLHQLRAALPELNARPIQARNGRTINLLFK